MNYELYEKEKKILREAGLTSAEYELAIKDLINRLEQQEEEEECKR